MLKPKFIILLIVGAAIGILMRPPKLVDEPRIESPVFSPSDTRASSNEKDAAASVSRIAEVVSEPNVQSSLAVQPSAGVARGIGPRELPEPKIITTTLGSVITYRDIRTDDRLVAIQILPAGEPEALRATGFVSGDLLIAVKGIAIEGAADSDQVMRSLFDTSGTTATVVRDGSKLDIVTP